MPALRWPLLSSATNRASGSGSTPSNQTRRPRRPPNPRGPRAGLQAASAAAKRLLRDVRGLALVGAWTLRAATCHGRASRRKAGAQLHRVRARLVRSSRYRVLRKSGCSQPWEVRLRREAARLPARCAARCSRALQRTQASRGSPSDSRLTGRGVVRSGSSQRCFFGQTGAGDSGHHPRPRRRVRHRRWQAIRVIGTLIDAALTPIAAAGLVVSPCPLPGHDVAGAPAIRQRGRVRSVSPPYAGK
jgi:hypothetical protein